MPKPRNSTDASSAFASCDSVSSEDSDDDDCQVVGVRLPPRNAAAAPAASPAASQKSRNSWSTWDVKSGKRPGVQTLRRGEAKTANGNGNGPVGPELVDDNQQKLRREWEAATLRRRTCPPMRSEGSKAGTNGHWGSRAPQSASVHQETDSSANLGGESGTAETVQSNGHVSPVKDVSFHNLSESTSPSADSVVHPGVEPRESGDAEPDEVASGSRKRAAPAPATDDQVLPESSSNSVFRNREDPPLNMESPSKFAKASCSTEVKKGSKRWCEPEDPHDATLTQMKLRMNGTDGASISGHDATLTQTKLRMNGTDGASISGHGGIDSLKHVDIGNQSIRDGGGINSLKHMDNGNQIIRDVGGFVPAFVSAVEQDIVGAKDKWKETGDYKLADEEEWERRQQEVQKQVSTRFWSSGIPSLVSFLGRWTLHCVDSLKWLL